MADVILLHDNQDALTAKSLAQTLRHTGWTVIDVIAQANRTRHLDLTSSLYSGHTVVALWSRESRKNPWFVEAAELAYKRAALLSVRLSPLDVADIPGFASQRGALPAEDHRLIDATLTKTLQGESIDPSFAKAIIRSPTIELMLWAYALWSLTATFLTLPNFLDIAVLSILAVNHWRFFIETSAQSLVGNFGFTLDGAFAGIVALTVFTANMAFFSRDERLNGVTRQFRIFPDSLIFASANLFVLLIFVGTSSALPNDPMLGLALRLIEIFNTPGGGWFLILLFIGLNLIPARFGDLHSYTRKTWIFILAAILILLQADLFNFRIQVEQWKRELIF